jgi:hypothetical protein
MIRVGIGLARVKEGDDEAQVLKELLDECMGHYPEADQFTAETIPRTLPNGHTYTQIKVVAYMSNS